MSRESYEKSLLFDVAKWTSDKRVGKVASIVLNDIQPHLGKGFKLHPKKYRSVFKNLVCNLILCHDHNVCEWVACSRNRNDYAVGSRYNKLHIGYDILINVISALEQEGYLEYVRGVKFKHFARMSRIRSTLKFVQLLYPPVRGTVHRDIELIRLQTKVGKRRVRLEYEDTSETNRMRRTLERLNAALEAKEISHGLTKQQEIDHMKAIGRPLDYTKVQMYRVFNDEFCYGGRFYGGWWLESKREYRKYIIIGGSPTVELDYSGLHPRILYDLEGVPVPEWDLYSPEGYEHLRGACKILFNSLLNAPTREKAIKGAMQKYNESRRPPNTLKKPQMTLLAECLIEMHEPIEKYLGSGIGRRLQYQDSCVAERIMLSLLEKGIVSLPVHDSFIVARQHEDALREAMMNEYYREFGAWPKIG